MPESVPPRAPQSVTHHVCPECGGFATSRMWGPECSRYDSHKRSAEGLPRSVKCVPVEYAPVSSGVEEERAVEAREALADVLLGCELRYADGAPLVDSDHLDKLCDDLIEAALTAGELHESDKARDVLAL